MEVKEAPIAEEIAPEPAHSNADDIPNPFE
jgi:hypothetical protein